MSQNILVFGSMSPYKIPKIKVDEIFTSNGSAELASIYKNKITSVTHTCIIGAKSYTKLDHIKKRVVNSMPDKLIIRDYKAAYSNIIKDFNHDIKIEKFKTREQFFFQKNFFKFRLFDLINAELKYEENIINKIVHMFNCISRDGFMGVSSGFFALLYAAKKHPSSNLIISGLSFEGGGHYYKSGTMTLKRGAVDNYLLNVLKEDVKKRLFCVDKLLAKKTGINYLETEILIT